MKQSLLDILRCVRCRSRSLSLVVREAKGLEVLSGRLDCEECGRQYSIRNGVLHVVDNDEYTSSFSFEWRLHRRTQLDDVKRDKSARIFIRKTNIDLSELEGKRVLDVGVGAGRYADVVSRAGADVVGVDLSLAVETAMENIGDRPNANIVQADLFDLPFSDESFDIIYSIGVLHHTPDCRRAFLGLARYLRPGGTIVIWVYNGHVWEPGSIQETVNRFWRSITTRLPSPLLYAACLLELPLYFLRRVPGVDQVMHLMLPGFVYHAIPRTNRHRNVKEHMLDTFDWYSPKYQSKHTYAEVFGWFEEAGLENIRVLPHPVAVSGKKPAAASDDGQRELMAAKAARHTPHGD